MFPGARCERRFDRTPLPFRSLKVETIGGRSASLDISFPILYILRQASRGIFYKSDPYAAARLICIVFAH